MAPTFLQFVFLGLVRIDGDGTALKLPAIGRDCRTSTRTNLGFNIFGNVSLDLPSSASGGIAITVESAFIAQLSQSCPDGNCFRSSSHSVVILLPR